MTKNEYIIVRHPDYRYISIITNEHTGNKSYNVSFTRGTLRVNRSFDDIGDALDFLEELAKEHALVIDRTKPSVRTKPKREKYNFKQMPSSPAMLDEWLAQYQKLKTKKYNNYREKLMQNYKNNEL